MYRKIHNSLIVGFSLLIIPTTFLLAGCGKGNDPFNTLEVGNSFVISNKTEANFLKESVRRKTEQYEFGTISKNDIPATGLTYKNDFGVLASRLYWEMAYNLAANYKNKVSVSIPYTENQPWYTDIVPNTITDNTIEIHPNVNGQVTSYVCRYVVSGNKIMFSLGSSNAQSQYFYNVSFSD